MNVCVRVNKLNFAISIKREKTLQKAEVKEDHNSKRAGIEEILIYLSLLESAAVN